MQQAQEEKGRVGISKRGKVEESFKRSIRGLGRESPVTPAITCQRVSDLNDHLTSLYMVSVWLSPDPQLSHSQTASQGPREAGGVPVDPQGTQQPSELTGWW